MRERIIQQELIIARVREGKQLQLDSNHRQPARRGREEVFQSLRKRTETEKKYEYENEAVSPQYADTSRVLSLMSVSSNKRSPTLRCTCLTTSHM